MWHSSNRYGSWLRGGKENRMKGKIRNTGKWEYFFCCYGYFCACIISFCLAKSISIWHFIKLRILFPIPYWQLSSYFYSLFYFVCQTRAQMRRLHSTVKKSRNTLYKKVLFKILWYTVYALFETRYKNCIS